MRSRRLILAAVLSLAAATVTADRIGGTGVSGRTVPVVYLGTTKTASSDGTGEATAAFNAGASTGTHNSTASFAADSTYAGSADNTNSVGVDPRPTTLTANDAGSV